MSIICLHYDWHLLVSNKRASDGKDGWKEGKMERDYRRTNNKSGIECSERWSTEEIDGDISFLSLSFIDSLFLFQV